MDHSPLRTIVDRAAHWEAVYRSKQDAETSWFQPQPVPSLDMIVAHAPRHGRILDVGGGASPLGPMLAVGGYDVTVVDIAPSAIERAKSRSTEGASRMRWIVGDILREDLTGPFDLWHDRAVHHFLTAEADRARYADLASRALIPGGTLIVAAFAPTGPERCSGLPVRRAGAEDLVRAFNPASEALVDHADMAPPLFTLVESVEHTHFTPWGHAQPFVFAVFKRSNSTAPVRR
jgi:SAM-dependent methyltransferase